MPDFKRMGEICRYPAPQATARDFQANAIRSLCLSNWLDGWPNAIFIVMNTVNVPSLPRELADELESHYFWWEPMGDQPRPDIRILTQAMDLASFRDVRRLETMLGPALLVDAMLQAEPGWISDRSWEFWRGRLSHANSRRIPEVPPRRSFDAGQF